MSSLGGSSSTLVLGSKDILMETSVFLLWCSLVDPGIITRYVVVRCVVDSGSDVMSGRRPRLWRRASFVQMGKVLEG